MKIIDFDKKGNIVRFYLGDDKEINYHGDDWDDKPYDCNAGGVYSEYIKGHCDIAFQYDWLVLEPCDGEFNVNICKNDMKNGKACIIAVPPEEIKKSNSWNTDYRFWASHKNIIEFHFEDKMEPSETLILYTDYYKK